jgi:acetylornithine deacetylase/succinyl-diaminopimelate desuccinylase-like protein
MGRFMNNYVLALAAAAGALVGGAAFPQAPTPNAQFQSIFKEIVETDSSVISGSCTAVTEKVAARLKAAGFPDADIHLSTPEANPKAGNLVVIYPGKDPKAKAVLMLGHIDVVNAKRSDWTRDPYVMVEKGGYFYARGVADMKAQDAIWIDIMLRYKAEGYKPLRTIKMALTCGEEGSGFVNGAGWLVANQRDLVDAGIALTEGGGGDFDDSGKKVALTVLAAEKSGANMTLEVTNPGGHSSRPRPDNAIYTMARALDKISAYEFPVQLNDANRGYFTKMAKIVGGEDGAAMAAIVANPADPAADARLNKSPSYHAMLRTVCSPTGIEGGHAPNAQPQRVTANINCRIIPNEPTENVRDALVKAIDDPTVKVIMPPAGIPVIFPPLTAKVMGPIETIAAKIYPGVPVVPMQTTGGTDGKRLNGAGIPTYGVSGLFRDPDGGGAHGLNERIRVSTVYEGRDFLYALIKTYADQK